MIRIAGSFPFLPQRLMVSGDTRRSSETSRIVIRSGKLSSDTEGLCLDVSDIVFQDYTHKDNECQTLSKQATPIFLYVYINTRRE